MLMFPTVLILFITSLCTSFNGYKECFCGFSPIKKMCETGGAVWMNIMPQRKVGRLPSPIGRLGPFPSEHRCTAVWVLPPLSGSIVSFECEDCFHWKVRRGAVNCIRHHEGTSLMNRLWYPVLFYTMMTVTSAGHFY